MNAEATFLMDRAYFELYYSEWIKHRSIYRRFSLYIAIIVLSAAALTFSMLSASSLIPWIILGIGVVELLDALTHRARWVRQRITQDEPQQFTVQFSDDGFATQAPGSRGQIDYHMLHDVAITPNGLFLIPQPRLSVFVPLKAIQPIEVVPAIFEKLQGYARRSTAGSTHPPSHTPT